MKVVEVSTEGVPQLYILIVLILFATLGQEGNCVGLLVKNGPWEITFLVLSLLQTYTTIILSTIASINIKNKGSHDLVELLAHT